MEVTPGNASLRRNRIRASTGSTVGPSTSASDNARLEESRARSRRCGAPCCGSRPPHGAASDQVEIGPVNVVATSVRWRRPRRASLSARSIERHTPSDREPRRAPGVGAIGTGAVARHCRVADVGSVHGAYAPTGEDADNDRSDGTGPSAGVTARRPGDRHVASARDHAERSLPRTGGSPFEERLGRRRGHADREVEREPGRIRFGVEPVGGARRTDVPGSPIRPSR